jgi:hypothetical protein
MVEMSHTGPEDDYAAFEIDMGDVVVGDDEPKDQKEANLPIKINQLFPSIDELNAAIAYINGTPETREKIREEKKHLSKEQYDFLNAVILSPITKGTFDEIKQTVSEMKEAILRMFKAMAEED